MASSSTLQVKDSASEAISFYQVRDSEIPCPRDTEKSMHIKILECRKNNDSFLKLLQALNKNAALESLDFNEVIWSTREVKVLCNVVKASSSLKRLSFRQSCLNPDGIKMLAAMLKKNSIVKELSFFKCDIKQTGALAIASSLKTNKCLEGLQIWEDSIGSKGAEELAKMIEENSSLRRLMVSDMQSIPTSSMVSATLERNRNLELQIWNSESQGKPSKVVELIPSNKVLRIYRIDTSGSYSIACALARNNTIENMDISGNHINSKCAEKFGKVLEENGTLKHLNMSKTGMSDTGVEHIAAALFKNHTLQSLKLEKNPMGGKGIDRLLCPLTRFKRGQQQANTSLKCLSIGGPQNKMGSYGVSALVKMISTNQSLLEFAINDDGSMGAADFVKILEALQRNTTLESLSLKGCKGVAGNAVLKAIVSTLQVNSCLKEIDLNETPLQASGKTDCVHQRLRQNTSAEPKIDIRKDMTMTVPNPAGVFQFAGKETLRESIEEGFYEPWQLRGSNCKYIGRHFECDDSNHTFLTRESFQTFKVHLRNKVLESCKRQRSDCTLEKNFFTILINGIQIRVELGGEMGYYIDILACSSQDLNETLRVLNDVVIQSIRRIYSSIPGCQGARLIEGILRPQCVQDLLSPRYRKDQFVLVEYLKQQLLSVPAGSIHNYQYTWSAVTEGRSIIVSAGFDYARNLLGEEDFRDVLERRSHDLYRLAVELEVPSANNTPNSQSAHDDDDGFVLPTFNGIAKGLERVLGKLKIMDRDIQDIKQEIRGLKDCEHKLLMEFDRKLSNLINFSVQQEERKVPRMFYFVRGNSGFAKTLVTHIVSGMTSLKLHLLCEYRRELHAVDGQPGCNLLNVDNKTVQSILPYVHGFMKILTFALKVGAQVVAGMGEMIPDLSSEVAQLENFSVLYKAGAGAVHNIEDTTSRALTLRSRDVNYRPLDENQFRAAQQWLVDFLKSQGCFNGKAIGEKFRLWRVRYTHNGEIAWVCHRHKEDGVRTNEVREIPMG